MSQANVVYLNTQVAVPATDSIADDPILAVYEAVVATKQIIEAQKALLEEGIEVLKKYMGDKEVLVSRDGRRLATWKQQGPRLELDREALKREFSDVWAACTTEVPGPRTFLLK